VAEVISHGSTAHVLRLLREGTATTRPQLVERTGLSRAVILQRIETLMALGLVREDGRSASSGGRRATQLRFARDAGAILVADLGKTHARLALTDLGGGILGEEAMEMSIKDGPEEVLPLVESVFRALMSQAELDQRHVSGIGIGLPGPVDHAAGAVVSPPDMPGWDGYPVARELSQRFQAPTFIENDVNIMALGEFWSGWRDRVEDLLFVKVGAGIGCGIILEQKIRRGRHGAAGHLGHIPVAGYEDVICGCGNTACVGAVASGIGSRLRGRGHSAKDVREVVELALAGVPDAVREVRELGRALGMVLSSALNLINPEVIVIGGDLAGAKDLLLAGVTEVVYQRTLPLATRGLTIRSATLGDRAGIQGAAVMVQEQLFSTEALESALRPMTPAGSEVLAR
jgi:predicted NBD/HSP70 family sugar kinase